MATPHFPLSPAPGTTVPLFDFMTLTILDDSYSGIMQFCPYVIVLLQLVKCPKDSSILSNIAESPPYLRLNNILHFLYLSFGGHLGYIYIFSLMNRTAMNMAVLISL